MNGTPNCAVAHCDRDDLTRGLCEMHYRRMKRRGTTAARMRPTTRERLLENISYTDSGCWQWAGKLTTGYGVMRVEGRSHRVHRLSYAEFVGPVPNEKHIDHKCHNRACINPAHLRLATPKQNAENRQGAQVNSLSGIRGVSRHAWAGKWSASMQHHGARIYLGLFETKEEAAEVVRLKRLELFTHSDHDLRKEREVA